MAVASSIFWVLGLILSVTIAPQLRLWTWGPCMLCFGVASLLAIPDIWKSRLSGINFFTLLSGFLLAAWIIVRAYTSPVAELAVSDALLVCMAVSTFIVFKNSCRQNLSEKILLTGITAILLATVCVIAAQFLDRSYSPVFPREGEQTPSGFHGHYSYCASFLIPCSFLVIAHGLIRNFHWAVRSLLFLIGASGLVALFSIISRGGVVGGGFGMVTLLAGLTLLGFREQKKWFFPLAIISPIVLLGLGVAFFMILGNLQESRGGGDLESMMDNTIRFYLLGIAVSCIQSHLWFGGGSRSFSWECFQFWDVEAFGVGKTKPEHVHNEFIQTISDYGILGGALLGLFIGGICIAALVNHLRKLKSLETNRFDAWRVGGIAGFTGLFIQSNFEGIFRIPPGAILLAACLAAASVALQPSAKQALQLVRLKNCLLIFAGILTALGLIFYGYKATRTFPDLWAVYFPENPRSEEFQIEGLSNAIKGWPLHSLVQKRAILYRNLSRKTDDQDISDNLKSLALKDFITATKLHPHDPYNPLNAGEILKTTENSDDAKSYFLLAIESQGGMEFAFRANQRYASYLLNVALTEYEAGKPLEAINQLQIAARYIEAASVLNAGWFSGLEGYQLQVTIYQSLGQTYEDAGEYRTALEQFDHAATLREGNSSHYLAALLLGKQAVKAWFDRRAPDGLKLFVEAERRLSQVRELPQNVTPDTRENYKKYLTEKITYLRESKIIPSQKIHLENN